MKVLVFRCLDEKEKNLQESLQRVQLLEKEIAARDTEVMPYDFQLHYMIFFKYLNSMVLCSRITFEAKLIILFLNRFPNVKHISVS